MVSAPHGDGDNAGTVLMMFRAHQELSSSKVLLLFAVSSLA